MSLLSKEERAVLSAAFDMQRDVNRRSGDLVACGQARNDATLALAKCKASITLRHVEAVMRDIGFNDADPNDPFDRAVTKLLVGQMLISTVPGLIDATRIQHTAAKNHGRDFTQVDSDE